MLEFFICGLVFGLFGCIWVTSIVSPGDVFDFIPRFYNFKVVPKLWQILPEKSTDIFIQKTRKLLYECERCIAGNLCFWYCILVMIINGNYSFISHLLAVCTAIYSARFFIYLFKFFKI